MGGVNQIIPYAHILLLLDFALWFCTLFFVCLSLTDAYIFSSIAPARWINRVHKHSPIHHPPPATYTIKGSHTYTQLQTDSCLRP